VSAHEPADPVRIELTIARVQAASISFVQVGRRSHCNMSSAWTRCPAKVVGGTCGRTAYRRKISLRETASHVLRHRAGYRVLLRWVGAQARYYRRAATSSELRCPSVGGAGGGALRGG